MPPTADPGAAALYAAAATRLAAWWWAEGDDGFFGPADRARAHPASVAR